MTEARTFEQLYDTTSFTTDQARDIWKELIPQVVRDRVLRGVALLDTQYASTGQYAWPSRIDLRTLNLQSVLMCVCGQLEGTYQRGIVRYGLVPNDDAAQEYSVEARDHGFVRSVVEPDGSDHSNEQLTVAWRAYLTLRRSGELT